MRRWLWCLFAGTVVGCCQPSADTTTAAEEESEMAPPAVRMVDPVPTVDLENLARTDPIAFLERCRERSAREIHSYSGTLLMHERVEGKLNAPERIRFAYREKPYSIRMEWKEGVKLARKTLYVEGENDGHILILPAGWRALAGIVMRLPDSEDATSSSRMPITQFGMQQGIERTLDTWRAVRERGELRVAVDGPKTIPELGNLPVLELKRIGYKKLEDDGIFQATFYYDLQTGLQVGIVLLGEGDKIVGKYFFRDLDFAPKYDKDTFTRAGLKKN